jgi:hypothetical protein
MAGGGMGWTGSTRRDPAMTAWQALSTAATSTAGAEIWTCCCSPVACRARCARTCSTPSPAWVAPTRTSHLNRARMAVFVALSSPEFLVQR